MDGWMDDARANPRVDESALVTRRPAGCLARGRPRRPRWRRWRVSSSRSRRRLGREFPSEDGALGDVATTGNGNGNDGDVDVETVVDAVRERARVEVDDRGRARVRVRVDRCRSIERVPRRESAMSTRRPAGRTGACDARVGCCVGVRGRACRVV